MSSVKYLCYLEKCNTLDSGLSLAKVNNTYYTFNKNQVEFLQYLNKNAVTREELYAKFSKYNSTTIDQFIDFFYKQGILIKKNSFDYNELRFLAAYRRLTRYYLPQRLTSYIERKSSGFIYLLPDPILFTKIMIYCSPILALFLFYSCYDVQLNLYEVPRNIATFLVGSVTAIIHELLIMIYHLKFEKKPGRIYIRIIYFIAISFGTEWGSSYSEKQRFRTWMFMFSMISIFYLSGIFFMIFYLLQYLKFYTVAYYASVYAVGILIFALINAYPFLLKTDGYILYQEFFDVYKVRPLFFKTFFYYVGMRNNEKFREAINKNNLKTYIWDLFFIASVIGLMYILYSGIRIII
ncbi:hypothetical protein [Streptococcus mitis]|uniref:hypothetical protein n=1 Tax=Streptococcus mitis TaxID=28037 RepID=UPI001CED9579|nr:hypothetical protein [Streptococcus mitis]